MSDPDDNKTVAELIAQLRAAGYNPELEALLARKWRCPHCRHECTILELIVPLGTTRDPLCPACEEEGIDLVEAPQLAVIQGGKAVPA